MSNAFSVNYIHMLNIQKSNTLSPWNTVSIIKALTPKYSSFCIPQHSTSGVVAKKWALNLITWVRFILLWKKELKQWQLQEIYLSYCHIHDICAMYLFFLYCFPWWLFRLLMVDASVRLTIDQVLGHPWLSQAPHTELQSPAVMMDKVLQWNLSWETTAMRDHLSWKTTQIWQKDLHLNITEPVTKAHLSWQTTFLWPMGWSFKTGSTV